MNRLALASSLTVAALTSACGTAPAPQHTSADDAAYCGRYAHPRARQVIASTHMPDGTVVDWIPIASQTREPIASPPPGPLPQPPGAPADASPAPSAAPSAAAAPSAGRGPAGTIPVIRNRAVMCSCVEGAIQNADGSCAPLADRCVAEGGMASGKTFTACCAGLTPIAAERHEADGSCTPTAIDAHVCAQCGDGACGAGESSCNCPADCH